MLQELVPRVNVHELQLMEMSCVDLYYRVHVSKGWEWSRKVPCLSVKTEGLESEGLCSVKMGTYLQQTPNFLGAWVVLHFITP